MKITKIIFLLLMIFSCYANAGQWSLGPVLISQPSPYVGGDSGYLLVPGISYQGERLIVRGPFVDYFLYGNGRSQPSVALTLGLGRNQLDVDGDKKLAGIEDRDSGFLGGIRFDYPFFGGVTSLGIQTDISSKSEGQRLSLGWRKPLFDHNPKKWLLAAGVELEWISNDYANYYFGVTRSEALISSFNQYTVDSVVQPAANIDGYYNLTQKWRFTYNVRYQQLASDVKDSPIVDESGVISGILGLTYAF